MLDRHHGHIIIARVSSLYKSKNGAFVFLPNLFFSCIKLTYFCLKCCANKAVVLYITLCSVDSDV